MGLMVGCQSQPLPKVDEQKNHFNHQIFEDNKLPPRATYFLFESDEILDKEKSKRFISLNGQWKISLGKKILGSGL